MAKTEIMSNDKRLCTECSQPDFNFGKTIIVVNDRYNDRLKELLSGNNTNFSPLEIGCPSEFLLSAGLPNLPIQMSVNRFNEKVKQCNHPVRLSDLVHLPDYVSNPIAIFRSLKAVDDVKVILTEMICKVTEANIVVIISPNHVFKEGPANSVKSLYPKDNFKDILSWVVEHSFF